MGNKTIPERLTMLEVSLKDFTDRYDRDTNSALRARQALSEDIGSIKAQLTTINNKEQQAIGMLRAARFGWVLLGTLAAFLSMIGLPKLAAWVLTLLK